MLNEIDETDFTMADFAEMKANHAWIVYADEGSTIQFHGAYECQSDAEFAMRLLNGNGNRYEMIVYFVDTEACFNTYPNIEDVYLAYGISTMVGLVPGGCFAATDYGEGMREAGKAASAMNDLLTDSTFPVFEGVRMKAVQIPFHRDSNRKYQA